jgi:CheY-like chemotaxis protein
MKLTAPDPGYNVMLVGNNPQELSGLEHNLSVYHKTRFMAEVSFDLKDSIARIFKSKPNYILLDDCYPVIQLKKFIRRLRNNQDTFDIPVALLKSSNKSHILVDGVQDFILKENFSAERLLYAIRNSRRIRRTQIILYKTFKKSRKHFQFIKSTVQQEAKKLTGI